jgi:LytS/YehU family sensor histidine kinase
MEYIRNYIDFQRLRKDEHLIVDFQIEIKDTGLEIAPLLLVVLIENAFKFVSNYSDKENKICIRIFTKGNILCTSFLNTKEVLLAGNFNNSSGIGIDNLKRRLELLYNNKYELTTNADNAIYETHLNIDLK